MNGVDLKRTKAKFYKMHSAVSQPQHSGAYHALTLHRIIEINLSFPMESNYGFGS